MSDDLQSIDPEQITPEQFASLVGSATDEQIESTVRGVGTERVLDRIFQGMQERFLPERAQGVDAVIQWVVTDEGQDHPYTATIGDGACRIERGRADSPRVTLTAPLAAFAKLVTGKAQGPALFMTGKLKVSGDLMFAQQVNGFFDRPQG